MLPTFSKESSLKISQHLPKDWLSQGPFFTSKLLNRQIKFCMNRLHRELMKEVLKHLERSIRSRSKDSWGASFCTILILCLCIEILQSAVETLVVCENRRESPDLKNSCNYSRIQSAKAFIGDLEQYPYRKCKELFRDVYGLHNTRFRDYESSGFNPLQACMRGQTTGLDPPTNSMVKAICDLVNDSCKSQNESPKNRSLLIKKITRFNTNLRKPSTSNLDLGLIWWVSRRKTRVD